MGAHKERGFTIVETMIFLGVSGLLLVGLLAGTTVAIQRQRYSDSINTTQGYVQQQYNEALNVVNNREGAEACNANNIVTTGSTEAPGTSECLVLGRAIDISLSDETMTSYHVVGRAPANADDPAITDDQLLQMYQPTLVRNVEPDEFSIPWGAKIDAARKEGAGNINRILILRSPRSGVLYTYAYETSSGQSNASGGVSEANRRNTVSVCIQSPDIITSTSVVSIEMSGGPEAVKTAFDITNPGERC
jgi:hypothetical protein